MEILFITSQSCQVKGYFNKALRVQCDVEDMNTLIGVQSNFTSLKWNRTCNHK